MNKSQLIKTILDELSSVHQTAIKAAQRAYDTATDEANEAENKYDTLGLEASYLAHGQSKRVQECEADLIAFKKLSAITFNNKSAVITGALVGIEDIKGNAQFIFLSPVAGGLKVNWQNKEVTLVTSISPLGKALMSQMINDDIEVMIQSQKKKFQIISIF